MMSPNFCLRLEANKVTILRRLVSNLWEERFAVEYVEQLESALSLVSNLLESSAPPGAVVILPESVVHSSRIALDCRVHDPGRVQAECLKQFEEVGSDLQFDIVSAKLGSSLCCAVSCSYLKSLDATLRSFSIVASQFIHLVDRTVASRDAVFFATVPGVLPRLAGAANTAFRSITAKDFVTLQAVSPDYEIMSKFTETHADDHAALVAELTNHGDQTDEGRLLLGVFEQASIERGCSAQFLETPVVDECESNTGGLTAGSLKELCAAESLEIQNSEGQTQRDMLLPLSHWIVGSPIGGVGVSIVTQMIRHALDLQGVSFNHISVDRCDTHGHSLAKRVFNDVTDFCPWPRGIKSGDVGDVNVLKYWDSLGRSLGNSDTLLEIGTNLSEPVAIWARTRRAARVLSRERPLRQVLIVVMPGHIDRSADFKKFVRQFLEGDGWKIDQICIVYNDRDLASGSTSFSGYEELIPPTVKFASLRVEHCSSPLVKLISANADDLFKQAEDRESTVAERYGLDEWEVYDAKKKLKEWTDAAVKRLRIKLLDSSSFES